MQSISFLRLSRWLIFLPLAAFIIAELVYGGCLLFSGTDSQCREWAAELSPWFNLYHIFPWSLIVIFLAITYSVAIYNGRKELMNSLQLSEDFQELHPSDDWRLPSVLAYGILTFGVAGFTAHLNFATSAIFEEYRYAVWPYLPLAKTGGYMLDFMLPLLLFPVMRHFMTWLRNSPATTFLTLDNNIKVHRFLGTTVFIPIALHVSMHLTWMAKLPPDAPGAPRGTFVQRVFTSYHGFTGCVILIGMVLIAVTSLTRVRRGKWLICGLRITGFDVFWNTHALYWLLFTVLFFHSENFLIWAFWPVCLFLLDKVLRVLYKHSQTSHGFLAGMVAPNILEIRVPLKHFNYRPGQWAFINVKELSKDEWHPFTISSNPEAEEVTWHMDTKGDWCSAFAELVEGSPNCDNLQPPSEICDIEQGSDMPAPAPAPAPSENAKTGMMNRLVRNSITPTSHLKLVHLTLSVDGPYGSGSEHAFDYNKIIMVSTGIGVTPFVSILRSMEAKIKAEQALGVPSRAWHVPREVFFYHVCRSRSDYKWYDAVLQKVQNIAGPLTGIKFKPVVYVTRSQDGKPIDISIPGEHRQGRPDWNAVLREAASDIGANAGEVGVFLCGSGAKVLQEICTRLSKETPGTQFQFNKEVFT